MQAIEIKNVLNDISKLETPDLERFLMEVGVLLARKKAPSLPKEEVHLLKIINNSLFEVTRMRYRSLRKKQQEKTLNAEERVELLNLVEVVENADVKRLKAMIALAQIRGVSLDRLMEQLGLNQPDTIL